MAVAQYCGTSVQMIMEDYCGPLELGNREDPATETSHSTELRQGARRDSLTFRDSNNFSCRENPRQPWVA